MDAQKENLESKNTIGQVVDLLKFLKYGYVFKNNEVKVKLNKGNFLVVDIKDNQYRTCLTTNMGYPINCQDAYYGGHDGNFKFGLSYVELLEEIKFIKGLDLHGQIIDDEIPDDFDP
jgi:hypothetical protein